MLQHPGRHHGILTKAKPSPWRCHYCGEYGHIKPFCYRLHGEQKLSAHSRANPPSRMRICKDMDINFIVHTPLRDSLREDWYFDIGCSRHMTGNQSLLVNISSNATGFVTFGDGAKGEIMGVGKDSVCWIS